jgi:predicted RNase H-related nuclease YkuK (DUF458 family)
MTRGGRELQAQVIERAREVLEGGDGWKARVAERGSDLRDRVSEVAERAGEAVRQVPKNQWAHKLTGSAVALIRDRAQGVQRSTVTYEVVSLASGLLGGALAGAIFNRIWRAVSGDEEAPEPTALDRNLRDVLLAGAVQGAVFGLIKAALGRITATGYRQVTGSAPNR